MKLALILLLVTPTFLALAQTPAQNANNSAVEPSPSAPCKDANRPEYRQFDFWVGEWNVFDRQSGKPVGKSSVQLILNDCWYSKIGQAHAAEKARASTSFHSLR